MVGSYHVKSIHTEKIIRSEEIIVPDLHGKNWRKMLLCLCQIVKVFLFLDNHHLLRW